MSEIEKEINEALSQAANAIKKGDVEIGRRLILWIIDKDPWNISALLGLAYISEDVKIKIRCYQRVLQKDPQNRTALGGLEKYQMEVPNLNRMIEEADHKVTHSTPLTDLESFGEFDSSDEHSNPVERKLDNSRRDLLDLSMWNKLLNYRALKTKGLEIIDELHDEIFKILVTDKRGMTFLHSPEQEVEDEDKDYLFSTLNDEEIKEFSQPDGENGLASRHTDNKLQTSYNSPILQKRLLSTYYTARTYIEEQGVNILYLALGMLNWYESDNSVNE